jgi:uncharacterized protein (DUF169 family)
MEDLQQTALKFRRILKLKTGPVAVKLIRPGEDPPVLFKRPAAPLPSLCLALMEAFKGKGLYCERRDLKCRLGLLALGFKGESLLSARNRQPVQLGVFGSQQAAQHYFETGHHLPAGSTKAIALSPLEKAVMGVDVVLLRTTSDQAMWIITAHQYLTGEHLKPSLGTGYQGVCGNVIAYPFLTNKINLAINGVGDRLAGVLAKGELFVGIPAALLQDLCINLQEIYQKPIFKMRQSRQRPYAKVSASRSGRRP